MLTPKERNIFKPIDNAKVIAESISQIPQHWSLTPLQDKAPRRLNWQTEPFIPHEVIASLIAKGEQAISKRTGKPYERYWSGFGLRTGDTSGGLIAIDIDGSSAQPILEAMSDGNIPKTVSWTSGKPGRYQLLFQIPDDIRVSLQNFTRHVVTQWLGLETAKDESGKPSELLEFRYNRCQSVLPPSRHPETGSYRWINPPANTSVALAPNWLCNLLLDFASEEKRYVSETKVFRLDSTTSGTDLGDLFLKNPAKFILEEKIDTVILSPSAESGVSIELADELGSERVQRQERKLTPISSNNGSLSDALDLSLNRLNPEDIFNWSGHNWRVQGRYEWAGYCPRHDSKSGTAFKVNTNTLEWHCFGCDVGGHAAQYRHFVNGGDGTPKGKDFAQIVKGLANEAGVSLHQEAKSEPRTQKKYIKPIKELPDVGFHIIRQSQDELLEKFDALETKRGREWLKLREFTPDVTINSQYFDYDFKPGENLAIKSGLGTGKSYFTNAKWLANPEEGAVLGGYRNCLNTQFCTKGKELNGRSWYQIQQDLKGGQELALLADSESRIAGAVDSWIYFSPHHFDEKKVVFDEIESVAKHLNQSSTAVSYYRDTIKSRVSDALQNSTANLIADGNLRDFTVGYIEELSGKKFTKILNEYKGNRGKIYLYNGSSGKTQATELDVQNGLANQIGEWISVGYKADDYSKLHRSMMDLPIDIPLLILSDSQKKGEAWDRQLTNIGRNVFRLDSTSSGTELGKLFLQNPAKFILEHKIDTVILSPSAESGVSIELADELKREIPGYFKYEFAYFFGVSTTDTQLQFLGRNRDPHTSKFAYIQSRSLNATQFTDEANSGSVMAGWAEIMRDCASLSLEGVERGEILKIATQKIEEQLDNPHLRYEAKLILKESFERAYPRFCFEYAARDAGWEVITIESKKDNLSDLKEVQTEISEERAVAIYKAENIDTSQVEALSKKLNKEPNERHQIAKARLLSRLPGIEQKVVNQTKKIENLEQLKTIEETETEKILTINEMPYEEWKLSDKPIPEKGAEVVVEKSAFNPELIDKVLNRDRKLLSRIESLFLLKNPEICKLIQQNKWHKKLDLLTDPDETRAGSLPIARYRSKWLEVHTLYEMGISFFLNPESCWDNESPEALAFWEKGKIPSNARNIGVSHEEDPCSYIGKVLARFELKAKGKQKRRADGTRYREYCVKPLNSEIEPLYECVENRTNIRVSSLVFDWKKILKNQGVETAETLTGNEEFLSHLPPYNLIINRDEVCHEPPVNIDGVPKIQGSALEQLIEALPFCDDAETFTAVIEDVSLQTVEDAIALSGNQPRRKQLEAWLEALQKPVKRWEWQNIPSVWSLLRWADRNQQVRLLAISADGFCQVRSVVTGLITNSHTSQLMPVSG